MSDLIKSVEKAGNEVFWFGAASDNQVLLLEKTLNLKLPDSFKKFLGYYGGGGVVESNISGIEDNDALSDGGGTVYGDTTYVREDYDLPHGFAVIFLRDDEVCWCLDTNNYECPVVSYNLFSKKVENKVANNFEAFFEKYLELRSEA